MRVWQLSRTRQEREVGARVTKTVSWLQVVLTAGAVYRLAILFTQDQITDWWRRWLHRTFTDDSAFVYLWDCPWCISIWIGAGAVALTYYQWFWWQWVCLMLVCSAVAGFLSERS
jgi:hypothetical protein